AQSDAECRHRAEVKLQRKIPDKKPVFDKLQNAGQRRQCDTVKEDGFMNNADFHRSSLYLACPYRKFNTDMVRIVNNIRLTVNTIPYSWNSTASVRLRKCEKILEYRFFDMDGVLLTVETNQR